MRTVLVPSSHIVHHGSRAAIGMFQAAEAVCLVVFGALLLFSLFHAARDDS
jgi:hypothetical protein